MLVSIPAVEVMVADENLQNIWTISVQLSREKQVGNNVILG